MASLSSSRFHAMRGVQAHARYALQLHRPDLGEGHVDPLGGIDDLLCDEDLTGPGVLGDPRGEVHRSSVVIALLKKDRSGVQANVSGWQAGGRYAVYQLEGRKHAGSRVAEVPHHAVTQPLHRPTAALERASSDESAQPLSQVGRGLVATLVCEAGVTGDVEKADGWPVGGGSSTIRHRSGPSRSRR